jgi:hypothetical protein
MQFQGSAAAIRCCKAMLGLNEEPLLRRLAFYRPEPAIAA